MPRYINADELIGDINNDLDQMTRIGIAVDSAWLWAKLNDAIVNAPTADVVSVVWCKDCKWNVECCRTIRSEGRKPDDFCSHGERRDDG